MQFDLEDSSPTITSCTIVDDDSNLNKDGGIWAFGTSSPVITDCVIWGNGDDLYGCSATYSCIKDNDPGTGNIHTNPQFTQGPLGAYYLSQKVAGQAIDSLCVNAGNPGTDSSLAAHLAAQTTRTDGVADAGALDLGAHYTAGAALRFPLTVAVVDSSNKPVDPEQGGRSRRSEQRLIPAVRNRHDQGHAEARVPDQALGRHAGRHEDRPHRHVHDDGAGRHPDRVRADPVVYAAHHGHRQ